MFAAMRASLLWETTVQVSRRCSRSLRAWSNRRAGALKSSGNVLSWRRRDMPEKLGIETIHQDLGLVATMTSAANFFLGREIVWGGALRPLRVMRRRLMQQIVEERLRMLHVNIPTVRTAEIMSFSGGQRQILAIARSVYWDSRISCLMNQRRHLVSVRQPKSYGWSRAWQATGGQSSW